MIFFPFAGKIIALIVAGGIGLAQGALFFGDPAAGQTLAPRLALSLPLAIMGGVIFGYNFNRLWFFAGLNAWVPAVFIGLSLSELRAGTAEPTNLVIMAAPIVASTMAGWIGSKMKAAKNFVMLVALVLVGFGALVVANGYIDLGAI